MAKANPKKPAVAAVAALAAAAAPVIAADVVKQPEIPEPKKAAAVSDLQGNDDGGSRAGIENDDPVKLPAIAVGTSLLPEASATEKAGEAIPGRREGIEVALGDIGELVSDGASHRIAGVPPKGFYRAGRHWPREGAEVARSDFTDDQWAALEAEPNLSIKQL